MKKWLALFALTATAYGCGGGAPKNAAMKEDLDALEQRLNRRMDESILKIEKQLPGVGKDYAEMLQVYQQMKNTLDDLKKLETKLNEQVAGAKTEAEGARKSVIRVLEEEEKILVDRLASLRATLEELKKK